MFEGRRARQVITGAVIVLVLAAFTLGARSEPDIAARRVVAEPERAVAAVAAPAATMTEPVRPQPSEPQRQRPADGRLVVTSTETVARLTGAGSLNDTSETWNVHGTDLGHSFLHHGRLHMVFGDTWGAGGTEGHDWRSNVMARISDANPTDGLAFDDFVADATGAAAELLPSRKIAGAEMTVIPTYGVSTGDRMILHYMSVRRWTSPGRWEANRAGLAYSEDEGSTWIVDPRATWPGTSNFVQVAFVPLDELVYAFGIPAGRFGGARLARVAAADMLRLDAYEYWDGHRWTQTMTRASDIVSGPVGELSVRWSPHHQRWIMMYLDEGRRAIVLRTAEELTGPWDRARIVANHAGHPQLYAPYLLPRQDGPDLYFTMSRFDVYNVFLMRTRLEPELDGAV